MNRFVLELPDKWDVKRTEVGENSETGEFVENSRKDGREPMTESENMQNEHMSKERKNQRKKNGMQLQRKKDRNCLSMRTGMQEKKLLLRVERWIMWRLHSSQRTEFIQNLAGAVRRLHHAMRLYSAGKPLSRSGIRSLRRVFKILPCDLIALQQAGWQVGRSSFLLHGFYQYHHLLLARKADGSFVLGVPGLQNPQECYMAQTFGFPDFKTAKWKDHGRPFGYYYKEGPARREDSL